jgi:AbrB family looped-hinge helix DNA binding protein
VDVGIGLQDGKDVATATLTSKGRITLPRVVRETLGVSAGDRVEFVELAEGQFAVVPAVDDVRALEEIVAKPRQALSIEEVRRIAARRGSGTQAGSTPTSRSAS